MVCLEEKIEIREIYRIFEDFLRILKFLFGFELFIKI